MTTNIQTGGFNTSSNNLDIDPDCHWSNHCGPDAVNPIPPPEVECDYLTQGCEFCNGHWYPESVLQEYYCTVIPDIEKEPKKPSSGVGVNKVSQTKANSWLPRTESTVLKDLWSENLKRSLKKETHGHDGQSCDEAHPDMSHEEWEETHEDHEGCTTCGESAKLSEAMMVLSEKAANQSLRIKRPASELLPFDTSSDGDEFEVADRYKDMIHLQK